LGSEVAFEDVAVDLLQARFWIILCRSTSHILKMILGLWPRTRHLLIELFQAPTNLRRKAGLLKLRVSCSRLLEDWDADVSVLQSVGKSL